MNLLLNILRRFWIYFSIHAGLIERLQLTCVVVRKYWCENGENKIKTRKLIMKKTKKTGKLFEGFLDKAPR